MQLDHVGVAVRDAIAQLRREPVAAAFLTLTIAVGVAASVAIYSVARGVVFRPLPYRHAESLVAIEEYEPRRHLNPGGVAFASLPRYRALPGVAALTAFSYAEAVVSGAGDAERVIVANADGDLFRTLGVRAQWGRGIEPADGGGAAARVAVLSNEFWRRRYGADPTWIGRSIALDGEPYTVVGVTGENFEFPRSPSMDRDVALWIPRRPPSPMMLRRGARDLTVIARLARGVSLDAIQSQLSARTVAARQGDGPGDAGWNARAVGLRDMVIGRVRPVIGLLSACVGMLFFIACANASAAMLARTTVRRGSYAVRMALGASTAQVLGVVLAEAGLISGAAVAVAIPLSLAVRATLVRLAPAAIPRQSGIVWTGSTTLVAASVGIVASLGSVAAALLWLNRIVPKDLLNESRTSSGSRARTRALATFVSAQAALGTMLFGATLALYARYVQLNSVDPGFETTGVTTGTIPMRGMRYRNAAARWNLTSQLVGRIEAIPGVQSAAVATLMPLGGGLMSGPYSVRDVATDSSSTAAMRAVSPHFFQTLGIAVRQGRVIGSADGPDSPPVAVVNEAFVKHGLGPRAALGASVTLTPPGEDVPREFSIVGVVANAKEKDLASEDSPIVYLSDAQASFPHTVLALRSRGPAPIAAVRAALHDLDPSLALDDVVPLAARVRATYALQTFQLAVLAMFAASALVLIAIGTYGAVAFVTDADTRATAVRLALGAPPGRIALDLLLRTSRWAMSGCVVGLALGIGLRSPLGLAHGVGDNVGIVAGALIVLAVALAATGRPSLRAAKVDVLAALNGR